MTSASSAITSQITSMAAVLVLIQLSRRIDITNSRNVLLIRLAYGVSQILSLLFLVFLRQRILAKKEKGVVEVEEPPKPFSQDQEPKRERISVCEYDVREVNKQIQQTIISLIIMCVLHGWLNFIQPLILQAILPWKNLLTLPVVRIHLWGSDATGDLARPWKAPNPLGDLMAAANETEEPKAIPASKITRVDDDETDESEAEEKKSKPTVKATPVNAAVDGDKKKATAQKKSEDSKPKRAGGRKED